jgi:hypothetical protein
MKKVIVMTLALLLIATSVYAMGSTAMWGGKPKPPAELNDYYSAFFQITPYCNSTVGKPSATNMTAWNNCYNCNRAKVDKKFISIPGNQQDYDVYSKLCVN